MTLYATIRSAYRLLPPSARDWLVDHEILGLHHRIVSRLERGAKRDELYDDHYYEQVVDPIMLSSADAIAASIGRELRPRSVIDVGCGTGALMLALERLGVRCQGFDYARAALDHCRRRGLDVRQLDIEQDPFPADRADVVVSTEVAEHLPESAADRFVALLSTLAPVSVITAAPPGSRGKDHVNEQPNEYWIRKFVDRGATYERDLTARLRAEWEAAGVDPIFFRSAMLFRSSRTN